MRKRIFALLLVVALVMGLFGCQTAPEETTQPTTAPTTQPTIPPTTLPPPPDPMEVYTEARAALEALANVTLDVTQVKTITVEGQDFVEESTRILTYSGLDTDAPVIRLEQEVDIKPINGEVELEESDDEEDSTIRTYSEIYADGTLYVELSEEAAFSGPLSAEASAKRYIPAVLLDAALYEDLVLTEEGSQTVITFNAPTAPESWAIPEEAELLEASGSAVIGADGKLQQMNYTITYQYGAVQVLLTVDAAPRAEAETAAVPEDTEDYIPVQSPEALAMVLSGTNMLEGAQEVSVSRSETVITQAGGAAYEQYAYMDLFEDEDGLIIKTDTTTHITDSQNGTTTTTREENYKDGSYVITVDGGVPTTQTRVKEETVRGYCAGYLTEGVAAPVYWQDVVMEDLGSVYLLEYTYTEDFGSNQQNLVCMMFWADPTMLNSLASAYITNEITGYLAIDKYTGLITASGTNYEGTHTIDGSEYTLSRQADQMVEQPSFGAYKEITEELRPEVEPEQKAAPLFYHVTGADGQEMWLLGTIHVGDVRTGFLPQELYDAFAASDALALEVDNEAFDKKLEEDSDLAGKVSDALYYRNGETLEENLDPELYAQLVKYMKASGNYSLNALYAKPYLWENGISNFFMQQGHQLHSELGVEERLTKLAKEQEKPIWEIESSLDQLKMLTGWSDELQQLLLEEVLAYSAQEQWTSTWELYELWCAGDEAGIIEEVFGEEDLSDLTEEEKAEYAQMQLLYEEYDKAMSHDRNAKMLKTAIEYLESEDVVFYAVGLAHLLDPVSGLVSALREAGYTVELVAYQQ